MSDIDRWLQWNESQTFERKSCYDQRPGTPTRLPADAVGRQIAETLCAMANADGGVLLVGQENARSGGIDGPGPVTGVDFVPRTLALLMDTPHRLVVPPLADAVAREESAEGHRVLVFQVASSAVPHRLTDGRCLLRVGTQNAPYSEQTVALLKQAQSPFERRPVPEATLADLDEDALSWFAERVRWSGDYGAMLEDYNLLRAGVLTRAALLLFARRPRQWHDHPDVVIVRYAGKERGLGERYQAQPPQRVELPLVRAVEAAYATLRELLRKRVELQDLFFQEQLEYPTFAWQEAVVNAVAHRDYALTGAGIEIWLFDDRMEVRSPGAPPAPMTVEQLRLREGAHYSRNPLIARVFTDCGYMREQGEGIPRMFEAMEAADLYPPELTIQDIRFVVTLRNTLIYDPETARWLRRFADLELSQEQRRLLAMAFSRGGAFTSREVQKQFKLDLYGASNLIKSLIRKRAVRLREKGGRIYEVSEPDEPEVLPSAVTDLLPAFEDRVKLSRRDLQQIWKVNPNQAYQRAKALVESGWLEPVGAGRGAGYLLSRRARNARAS
jgi:ATP-dependent DNA helicase RecG